MPRILRGIGKICVLTIGRYWEKKILRKVDQTICLTEKGWLQMLKRLKGIFSIYRSFIMMLIWKLNNIVSIVNACFKYR